MTRRSLAVKRNVARRLRVESGGPDMIRVFGAGFGGGDGGGGGGGWSGGHVGDPAFGALVATNVAQIKRPRPPLPGGM